MKTLALKELETIKGGSAFCNAFAIGGAGWAIGAAANLWNPPGIIASLALAGAGLYCMS